MGDRLWLLVPEFILLAGAMACALGGISRFASIRRRVGFIASLFLALALIAIPYFNSQQGQTPEGTMLPNLSFYIKMVVAFVGLLFVATAGGLVDRTYEKAIGSGKDRFDPLRSSSGEFHALLLLSLTGVMLLCEARDLIWLFLALELVSLPTYVMVAVSRWARTAQEAAMKYFFLGALSAALMLYGFALLYASTGSLVLQDIAASLATQQADGGISAIAQVGMLMAIFGLLYKIAAAPMHLYAPDVYQGAASPVTAFLAFVPKTAGMIAIMTLLTLVGWDDGLPPAIEMSLWVVAVLTMILGNIGALLQRSAKRMLGYSSIAHSGYMLIGVIAGPELGFQAVLVYLLIYGVTNTSAFATLAALSRNGKQVDSLDDLAGLYKTSPLAAAAMAISCGSLLGIPPLFGFWGKLLLFAAGIAAGQLSLIIVAAVSSAVSAWYYLRIIGLVLLSPPQNQGDATKVSLRWPLAVALVGACIALVGPVFLERTVTSANEAIEIPEAEVVMPLPSVEVDGERA
ncbi:MAG: NADH-quinone oxidoreductase subunit N [Phycisphaerales bacterium]|jgi:NADH-quinone oxidoreductase subunit N|nr:NADH-quinone oxidoreductase subunit N [Phycisphaerales bacterium]